MPKKYEILNKRTWVTCKKANPTGKNGFLHYELYDGTNGLARSGTWREKGNPVVDYKMLAANDIDPDDNILDI